MTSCHSLFHLTASVRTKLGFLALAGLQGTGCLCMGFSRTRSQDWLLISLQSQVARPQRLRAKTKPIRPFIYWHPKKRNKSRQQASTSTFVTNSSSELLMDLLRFDQCAALMGERLARSIVFLFASGSFFLMFPHTLFLSHLPSFFFFFHAWFVFQTLVCVGSHLPAKALMEK